MSEIERRGAYGTSDAFGTYDYRSGNADATVSVPASAYIDNVSAFSNTVPGTVQIGTGNLVPIPLHGSVTLDVGLGIMGPVDIIFTGVNGYLVEWRIV
jgi:hypothetical protein